jgi:putative endonuclease
MNNKKWLVYLVRCSDKSLYCGISNDIKRRLIEHNSGKGAKYTRARRPVELVDISPEMTKSEALKLEYRIKQLPANKKISKLTRKENGMAILKKDLQALNKGIQALGKTIDKLIAAVEKGETKKVAKKTTAKPIKAKTTKKSPTPAQKAPAKKKPAQLTAIDQVLEIINGSKNGVNTATLMEKTGFDQRKIWSIINRASKAGKIKRTGRGIYIGA